MRSTSKKLGALLRANSLPLGILFLLALTSCARQVPNAPTFASADSRLATAGLAANPAGAFFPLAIGNHWHAVADDIFRVEPPVGPPYEEFRAHSDINRALIGTETLFGRPYVVLAQTTIQDDPFSGAPRTYVNWIRYRQDASGLYEADVSIATPPNLDQNAESTARSPASASVPIAAHSLPAALASSIPVDQAGSFQAAWGRIRAKAEIVSAALHRGAVRLAKGSQHGGLLPGEITRLRYPLHPGTAWAIRPDPLFSSTVEAIEVLDLPAGRFPAYRTSIVFEGLGPLDSIHAWFGRSGQLELRYHLESEATDSQGNVIGRMVDDYDEVLDDIALVRP